MIAADSQETLLEEAASRGGTKSGFALHCVLPLWMEAAPNSSGPATLRRWWGLCLGPSSKQNSQAAEKHGTRWFGIARVSNCQLQAQRLPLNSQSYRKGVCIWTHSAGRPRGREPIALEPHFLVPPPWFHYTRSCFVHRTWAGCTHVCPAGLCGVWVWFIGQMKDQVQRSGTLSVLLTVPAGTSPSSPSSRVCLVLGAQLVPPPQPRPPPGSPA